ncbi:lysophospholipase L1-like esterase [Actinoplanes xinjiangensis]|uniref:Lysophospholipase L1-like esterase n=1 Tax=Actinoplanes xinjiangensis TaxID=512350 RepID=A0A316F7H6_9ACTN|nr:lysophospholipase L1-like esterase [Actinoplanes xinjiangensis]GIF38216.1 SGNH hydrolase [Actinoplanes xinjiangensis]
MTTNRKDTYFNRISAKSSLIGLPDAVRQPAFHRAVTRRGLLLAGAGATVVMGTPGEAGEGDPIYRRPARVGTWAAAPTAVPARKVLTLAGKTVRQVVHTSVGGDLPRVTLSNEFGTEPVRIGAATIGLRAGTRGSCDTVPGSIRPLTFGGSAGAVLAPGGVLFSDPADLLVAPGADLVISLHLPGTVRAGTVSPRAKQSNLIVDGDATFTDEPGGGRRTTRYLWLTGISVRATGDATAIVALGDSITCGTRTTDSANHRWPDLLSRRLRGEHRPRGLLNAGLSGNRLLFGYEDPTGHAHAKASIGPAALRRFERDVLAHPGVRHVVTLIGVNDLGNNPRLTAAQLIAGHRELIDKAKINGLRVYGGTLLPFGGSARRYDTRANETKRQELNHWIRTAGQYDAVIDFDAAVRDPRSPRRMRARYDCGDGLHPNDLGTAALAAAVPLEIFETREV